VIVERHAVRAILYTPEQEVLLMRIHPPHGGTSFWITPGGGLNPGESPEAGLRRELKEELGLENFTLGPLLWRRQHTFQWGQKRLCQRERLYAVPSSRFEPHITDAVEAEVLDEFRWWTLAELSRTTDSVTPAALARIVADYLLQGPPCEPLDVEILDDLGLA
jgi:8-oxo-dGTP pyrophosphatase MutT (NUDIX family)